MRIARIRITGGFLAGLDISTAPGLNVVIGPRGAGKTTLLELVRHALGPAHAQAERDAGQQDFIRAVLGSGEVILDLEDNQSGLRVIADAEGNSYSENLASIALTVSQNELEKIASDANSRRALLDLRANLATDLSVDDAIIDLSSQLVAIRLDIEALDELLEARSSLQADLEVLEQQEANLMASVPADLSEQRQRLTKLEHQLQLFRSRQLAADRISVFANSVDAALIDYIGRLETLASIEPPETFDDDFQLILHRMTVDAHASMESLRQLETIASMFTDRTRFLEDRARLEAEPLRSGLERAEQGLGQLTATIRNIRMQLDDLSETERRSNKLRQQFVDVRSLRDGLYDDLESQQELIYEARYYASQVLSSQLSSDVRIDVRHLADSSQFRAALITLLQGSNLQYRSLVETMSRRLLPRQLLDMVERADVYEFELATGIGAPRSQKILIHLRDTNAISTLAQVSLEDTVDFVLIDEFGNTRNVETLSTGQKCAITLPILLTEMERILILDQPEDNLDNAFLVNRVIGGLNARSAQGAQTLIATHNPNIPVLGGASAVFSMQSDGAHGAVGTTGRFNQRSIVHAITTLMEGGMDAFRTRARFYESDGQSLG